MSYLCDITFPGWQDAGKGEERQVPYRRTGPLALADSCYGRLRRNVIMELLPWIDSLEIEAQIPACEQTDCKGWLMQMFLRTESSLAGLIWPRLWYVGFRVHLFLGYGWRPYSKWRFNVTTLVMRYPTTKELVYLA